MTEVEIVYEGGLRTRCVHEESGEALRTDAPKDNQGKGEFFSPTDLIGVALGSCILTIMGIYAKRHNLDLTGTKVNVSKEMKSGPRRIGKITLNFTSPHKFDAEVQKQLEKAATECPVHASLHPDLEQIVTFEWGKS
ncbi:MAG: OsmC family protein [Chlamydiales bacterium]|nr:OsmC family protein [Chlamydiales bacterium]